MQLEVLQALPITEAEVAGFAAKLEAWCETLLPSEQAALERLLACAEGAVPEDTEVEGYAVTGIRMRLTRSLAAGALGATLATPLAAPGDASADTVAVKNVPPVITKGPVITLAPEDYILSKAAVLGAAFTGNALSGL